MWMPAQKGVFGDVEGVGEKMFRCWQLRGKNVGVCATERGGGKAGVEKKMPR